MLRGTLTVAAALLAATSAGGAQDEALAAASKPRIEFKTERIPVRFADKGFGFVEFDIQGEVGGPLRGRFIVAQGRGEAAATMTAYAILRGSVVENETEYEFIIERARRVSGARSSEQISSRLKLAKAPRSNRLPGGISAHDSWRETAMADGDIWTFNGKPCQFIGGDLVCSP